MRSDLFTMSEESAKEHTHCRDCGRTGSVYQEILYYEEKSGEPVKAWRFKCSRIFGHDYSLEFEEVTKGI